MSLVLIGTGGHAQAVAEVARSAGFSITGLLSKTGLPIDDEFQILGGDDWIGQAPAATSFHLAFGPQPGAEKRAAKFEALRAQGLSLPAIVASTAIMRGSAVGEGSVIMHAAAVNVGATIGRNCIVNTGAIVEHHSFVGDHSHIAPGAVMGGAVRLSSRCTVGLGAVLLPGIALATGVTVGAGAVVVKSIDEPFSIWVGNPARRVK